MINDAIVTGDPRDKKEWEPPRLARLDGTITDSTENGFLFGFPEGRFEHTGYSAFLTYGS